MLSGPLWAVLGCSWGLCGRSWAALGASVGGPGRPLGPLWAVLGHSWGLCGLSWGGLGRKVALSRAGRRSQGGRHPRTRRTRRGPLPKFIIRYLPVSKKSRPFWGGNRTKSRNPCKNKVSSLNPFYFYRAQPCRNIIDLQLGPYFYRGFDFLSGFLTKMVLICWKPSHIYTPYSMNSLFSEFFRKFSGGILGVCETILGLFWGHFGCVLGGFRGKNCSKNKNNCKSLIFYYY